MNVKKLCFLLLAATAMPLIAATAQAPATGAIQPADKEVIKVGCIGNSITYGLLVADREKNNYPVKLQEILGEGYEVRNFGKSGATLLKKGHRPYNEQEEFADALEFAPDLIVVHLGVNDTDPRDFPDYGDEFVTDYVALVDSFKKVNPDVRVILANLSPLLSKHYRYRSGTRAWRDSIRNYIPEIAKITGSELIDFGEVLRDHPNLLPDGIHPNKDGALKLAEYVASAITGDFGPLSLPEVYGDGMVLQRYKPLTIRGTAKAGDTVTVKLGRNTASTVASNTGKWSVTLPPMKEATGLTMTVTDGKDVLKYSDVAVGEVWLASGQSNMEFRMKNSTTFQDDKDMLNDPLLRLFDMKPVAYTNPGEWDAVQKELTNNLKHYNATSWKASSDSTAPSFSAVAWYFGKMLRESLDVPVGIINNAIGGSTTESWIDIETLEHTMPEVLVDWHKNDYVQPWAQQRATENIGETRSAKTVENRHPYEPTYLFASGIRPLGAYPIAGTIWYQGESNAHNTEVHEALFETLVNSFRNNWNQPDMPFFFVQLSSLNRPSWPVFRDSQRRLANKIPGVAMAVSSDKGDSLDVHPRDKRPVGERLARQALNRVYSMNNVTPQGPTIKSARKVSDNAVALTFDYADGLATSDGKTPLTFEVAEFDGWFQPVDSAIITENNEIILYSMNVKNPRYVRYGWQPFTRANLVNADGLPASTFRIDVEGESLCEAGIEAGISGLFLGKTNGAILMAGGCNFPSNPMAPDAKKKFYKGIYKLSHEKETGAWKTEPVGALRETVAYGCAVSTPKGIYLIGGTTPEKALVDVCVISLGADGIVAIDEAPALPVTVDNAAGAYCDGEIYVVGGNVAGKPSNRVFCLDTEKSGASWEELKSFPGNARVQPVAAAGKDAKGNCGIYMWGGFAGKTDGNDATLNTDGYLYDIKKKQWKPLAAPTTPQGEEISTGGGAATTLGDGRIAVVGGVNKDVFLAALQNQAPDYLSHPAEWYRFNNRLLVYNPVTERWEVSEPNVDLARAGAAIVAENDGIIVVGGEIKPRIRTADLITVEID